MKLVPRLGLLGFVLEDNLGMPWHGAVLIICLKNRDVLRVWAKQLPCSFCWLVGDMYRPGNITAISVTVQLLPQPLISATFTADGIFS